MANYNIEISATAERQIRKINKQDQIRVLRTIQSLSQIPYPKGCRKLRGYQNIYRIREGNYRVIYSVEAKRLLVIILKAGHRKDVYK